MSKLVRDNIPTFIKSSGKIPVYHVEEDKDKKYKALVNKLVEEAKEVKDSKDDNEFLHEIADVYEVFTSLLRLKDYTLNDAQEQAKSKRAIKGSFDKFIILDRIEEASE